MDWLKCNICFNTYNESSLRPRSLSCGHTFCERCLNNTIQNETLTCPQCRKKHEINSALDLPINFIAEGLLKSLNTCSQDKSEGAISRPVEGDSNANDKTETHGSLRSFLEQQEKSLFAQKELLKTSAGMCIEHPSKEYKFRCSLHKSWVCEQCIEEKGDHPRSKCTISSFKKEIEDRRQEYKKSLDDEGKSCDETLSVIEKHIFCLRDERESHISLINSLQELVNIHKKEEENLQIEITAFQNIIEKGKHVKQMLVDVEVTVLDAETVDESNAARDLVENKNAGARNWINTSHREVDKGKLKIERSNHLAMSTKMCLEHREKRGLLHKGLEKNIKKSGQTAKSANKIKLKDIELARKNLNKITHLYENELNDIARSRKNPWNFMDCVTKVQLVLLGLLSKISENGKDDETTTWAVKASNKDCSVLAGQLISSNGRLLLHSMQTYDSLPRRAIILPYEDVLALSPSPPEVFLMLTHNGTKLGSIQICLDGQSVPRRVRQFMELTTGSTGRGSYRNASFTTVMDKSHPGEWMECNEYTTYTGGTKCKALYHLEKEPFESTATKGAVYGIPEQVVGFGICTRGDPGSQLINPVIGHVTSGLALLKAVIHRYSSQDVDEDGDWIINIVISECGLSIDSAE